MSELSSIRFRNMLELSGNMVETLDAFEDQIQVVGELTEKCQPLFFKDGSFVTLIGSRFYSQTCNCPRCTAGYFNSLSEKYPELKEEFDGIVEALGLTDLAKLLKRIEHGDQRSPTQVMQAMQLMIDHLIATVQWVESQLA